MQLNVVGNWITGAKTGLPWLVGANIAEKSGIRNCLVGSGSNSRSVMPRHIDVNSYEVRKVHHI